MILISRSMICQSLNKINNELSVVSLNYIRQFINDVWFFTIKVYYFSYKVQRFSQILSCKISFKVVDRLTLHLTEHYYLYLFDELLLHRVDNAVTMATSCLTQSISLLDDYKGLARTNKAKYL